MSKIQTKEEYLSDRDERLRTPSELGRLAHNFTVQSVREKYFYNFEWLGLPIIQFPQDLIALQEIIWNTKPDVIIETGLAWGGSAVFYGSCLNSLPPRSSHYRRVVSIEKKVLPGVREDVQKRFANFAEVMSTIIEGSSVDLDISAVEAHRDAGMKIMVCLDSAHHYEHVKAELELWAPLVSKGCYLVVFDTFVRNMPGKLYEGKECVPGNDPMGAVQDFLSQHPEFEIDAIMDRKTVISSNPKGYLRRTK